MPPKLEGGGLISCFWQETMMFLTEAPSHLSHGLISLQYKLLQPVFKKMLHINNFGLILINYIIDKPYKKIAVYMNCYWALLQITIYCNIWCWQMGTVSAFQYRAWLRPLLSDQKPSCDPPIEPAVEAPAKPPISDDEIDDDEIEDKHFDEVHYDFVEKAITPPGDYWSLLSHFKPAVGWTTSSPSAAQLWFNCSVITVVLRYDKNSIRPANEPRFTFTILVER